MIIDRTADVVPTRYANPELRKVMGDLIAQADDDDLLAAWLWTTEGWILRQIHSSMKAHASNVQSAIQAAVRRQRAAWGTEPTPVSLRFQKAAGDSFEKLIQALTAERSRTSKVINALADAWEQMSDDFGIDPLHLFSRSRRTGDTSPVERVGEFWSDHKAAPQRLAETVAHHRDDMHELAIEEQRSRCHLERGQLSAEGGFLMSTFRALRVHRDRVAAELAPRSAGEVSGGSLPELFAVQSTASCILAGLARDQALRDERGRAGEAFAACVMIWEEMAEDFGLEAEQPVCRRADGPAKVVALAELAAQGEAGVRRVDQILSAHREAVHAAALLANRRIDFIRSGSSIEGRHIDRLSHRDFEKLVADLTARDGLRVTRRNGGAGDLGADVTAVASDGRVVVFQAKHTSSFRTIGSPELQRFNGTARPHHKADIAVMVTNGTYSAPAETFAAQHRIHLMDYLTLTRWATWGDPLFECLDLPAG